MAKSAFKKKNTPFANKLDLYMKRKQYCATFGTYVRMVLKIRHFGVYII
jgi:hypothetical protein